MLHRSLLSLVLLGAVSIQTESLFSQEKYKVVRAQVRHASEPDYCDSCNDLPAIEIRRLALNKVRGTWDPTGKFQYWVVPATGRVYFQWDVRKARAWHNLAVAYEVIVTIDGDEVYRHRAPLEKGQDIDLGVEEIDLCSHNDPSH